MKRFVHGPILSYSPYLALALFLMLLLTSLNYFYLSAQNYQLLTSNTNQQKDIDQLQVNSKKQGLKTSSCECARSSNWRIRMLKYDVTDS